jgi:hypothetical protein
VRTDRQAPQGLQVAVGLQLARADARIVRRRETDGGKSVQAALDLRFQAFDTGGADRHAHGLHRVIDQDTGRLTAVIAQDLPSLGVDAVAIDARRFQPPRC